MNSGFGFHEHSRLIVSLRVVATFILLASAIARVAQFHSHAIYPVPLLPLLGRDLLLATPFLSVIIASYFVRRTLPATIFLLVLSAAVVASGVHLDLRHFAHLNKDSMFDGVDYIGHTLASLVGAILLVVFQPSNSNATVA